MALSESDLAAAGVSPGPMVIQTANGKRMTVRPKSGPARTRKTNYYRAPKSSRKGGRR